MMKLMKYIIALVCAGMSMTLLAQQPEPAPDKERSTREERNVIRAGNKHFKAEEYDAAEEQYRKALDINPNSEVASYNLATTLYKKEQWKEARKEDSLLLLRTRNKERRARVYHNLGNISFKEKNFAQSVEEYKNALRLNPKDDETRYNLRVAQLLLKEQQNNQQNQQQDQQEQQQEQQQQQQEQQQEQKEQQEEQNKSQEQEQKEQEQQEQQQQQPAQPQPDQMTQENAEQILRAIEQDERETQEKVQELRMEQQKRKKTDKEW